MSFAHLGLDMALHGIKVLDVSRVLAGPFCGQHLADLGADVVKLEQPGLGDETRSWGPPFQGEASAYFLACNRGKRAIALDLASARGHALFRELVAKADILIENFRSDSAVKLGVTAASLHALNPRLIIVSLSGFGRDGMAARRAGYDFVVQGMSGMMAMTGPEDGAPHKFGVAIADIVTGLYAATGALAALRAREQSGHGYAVEVALFDCAVASMVNVAQAYLTSGIEPRRQGNAHLQIVPYQMFATQDGWLVLAVGNDHQWRKFCDLAEWPALAADPRFARNEARVGSRAILVPLVAEIIAQKTTAQWEALLTPQGVPCGPVWNLAELFSSDVAQDRGLRITVRDPKGEPVDLVRSPLVRTPAQTPRFPPRLGEHTREVCADWLNMDESALAELARLGIL